MMGTPVSEKLSNFYLILLIKQSFHTKLTCINIQVHDTALILQANHIFMEINHFE